MVGYLLSLNVSRELGSRCDVGAIRSNVVTNLTRQGFVVEACTVQVNVVSAWIGSDRAKVATSIQFNMAPSDMTAGRTRAIDSTVLDAVKQSCRGSWDNESLRRSLPATGNAEGNGWTFTGDVGSVVREVSSVQVPSANRTSLEFTTTPIASTDRNIAIGVPNRSELGNAVGNAAARTGEALNATRTPVIIAGVALTAVAVAFVVYKVK